MEKINKFVLISIIVAISISFIFSTTSLAKSNLPEVFLRTRNLNLGYRTSGFFNGGKDDYDRNVQYSYYRKLFLGADNMPWKCSVPRSIAKNSFDKAVRDGNIVITQTLSLIHIFYSCQRVTNLAMKSVEKRVLLKRWLMALTHRRKRLLHILVMVVEKRCV